MALKPFLSVLLALALSVPCWAAPGPQPLRLCLADSPHAPWREAERDGLVRHRGLDFALLDAVRPKLAQQHGFELKLQIVSAKRCLVELEAGRIDAIVGLSHTPERAVFLRYPMRDGQLDPRLVLRHDAYFLFTLKNGAVQWDGKTLLLPPGGRLGVQTGHSAAYALAAAGVPMDDKERRADRLLDAVQSGQLVGALLLASEGEVLRRTSAHYGVLVRREPAYLTKPYFVVFSKTFAQAHEAQLPGLWEAFAQAALQLPAYQRAAAHPAR